MKLARLAVELVLDVTLIAVVAAIVAWGRQPPPPAPDLAHDPSRCSACTHPNARVPGDGSGPFDAADNVAVFVRTDQHGLGSQSR